MFALFFAAIAAAAAAAHTPHDQVQIYGSSSLIHESAHECEEKQFANIPQSRSTMESRETLNNST